MVKIERICIEEYRKPIFSEDMTERDFVLSARDNLVIYMDVRRREDLWTEVCARLQFEGNKFKKKSVGRLDYGFVFQPISEDQVREELNYLAQYLPGGSQAVVHKEILAKNPALNTSLVACIKDLNEKMNFSKK
jgi:hypothetical protein